MSESVLAPAPSNGIGWHAARMTLAGMLQRVTGAIGGVIAAHLLGPSGRGVYALVVLVGAGGALLVTCGLQFWVARLLAVDAKDARVRAVLVRHAGYVVTGVVLVTAALLLLVPSDQRATGVVAAALTIANAGSLVLIAIPTGQRRTGVTATALGIGGAVWLAWLGAAVALDMRSPATVALGAVLSHVAVGVVCLRRGLPSTDTPAFAVAREHRVAVRTHLAPGLGEVVLLSAFRVDVALVAILASPATAGIYAVATSLAELLWLVPDAVSAVLLPHLSERPDAGVRRPMQATALSMGIVALPLVVVPERIISAVFGSAFVDAADCVPWLVLGALFLGVWKVESAALVARGAGTIRLASAVAALCVVLAGDLLLVPAHGAVGAAWACAAGYLVAAWVVRHQTRRFDQARMQV